ncbi:MAG: hypothetical protein U0324_18185 [Polyangiales bacterium]
MRTRALALAALFVWPSVGAAQTSDRRPAESVRVRLDAVFRGVPRYVLTASDQQANAPERYWRAVTLAPLVARANLDAQNLLGGRLETHLSAWGAVDLALAEPGSYAAGDLAVAWARATLGPWSLWAGRRFVPWGPPGGLHVDGIGGEARAGGFAVEVMVGRPVTPAWGALVGAQPGFDGVTAAAGARVAWAMPGRVMASAAYVERWAYGVAGVRAVSLDAVATPNERLDLRGSLVLDATGAGVTQAGADVDWSPGSWGSLGVGYAHVDPARLIPRWSILSVFVTDVFDEARAWAVLRPARAITLRVEGAGQRYAAPGTQDDARWGHRVEAALRLASADRRRTGTLSASRRDDGVRPLTLVRAAGLWTLPRDVAVALELAAALDDDSTASARTSLYGRASVEVPLGRAWRAGASLDGVRSPIAAAELRGMAHASWTFERGGGRP